MPAPRILIARLSALGDVLLTLPVLTALRETYPEAWIGWVVEAEAATFLKGHPSLDALHVSHRKRWMRQLFNPLQWPKVFREFAAFRRGLQEAGYTVGLDAQGLMKSALALWLAGIPRRLGMADSRENAHRLYTEVIPLTGYYFAPEIPIDRHLLQLARALGFEGETAATKLPPAPADSRLKISNLLDPISKASPLIALAPATQWASKQWSTAYWQTLVCKLLAETQSTLFIVGGPGDKALCDAVLKDVTDDTRARCVNLCGQTSLGDMQALFERVDLVVGADSMPLHLAGAVGHARLIGLYGPTSAKRTPPPNRERATLLSTQGQLPCQPCDARTCRIKTHDCLTRITPETMFVTIQQLIRPVTPLV